MSIKLLIPPIFEVIYKKLKYGRKSKYQIGKYEIEMPRNFALPKFQSSFRLYDRFLPVLAKNIDLSNSDKLIIDVGANIGDTVVAMLQYSANPFVCIEPSDYFFSFLEKNLKNVSESDSSRVKIIKELVGTGLISGTLDHNDRRTASLKVSDNPDVITHIPLDKLIDNISNVILLKVDTDGFDYDVIKSAENILSTSQPILFWENEITEDFQYEGFVELYKFLDNKNYKYVYIFDNYGNLITESISFETLKNINAYMTSMRKFNCTRTFYYTDVLAATEKNISIVKNAIAEYRKDWINK